MKLKNKPWFKKVIVTLLVIIAAALCLLTYYYFTEVHKDKLCRTLDNLTREQIENISLLSQNGEVAVIKDEDEIEDILELVTKIDAYGRGERYQPADGGTIPAAFYIELKDGTSFYVGTDGVIAWKTYKVRSDWMLNEKLRQLYWTIYNRYSVPWTEVRQKVSLELVEDTLTDTGATFIIHNDSYYDIYIDGEFRIGSKNTSWRPYSVDKTKAQEIKYRSQYEITLDWSDVEGLPHDNLGVTLYYITKDARFGAYTTCEIKK